VRKGETLSQIAQRQLGSKSRWSELYKLNKSVIADPNDLKVGTVLRLPQSV
jgi:nucleoid-associated protein YgaU